MNINKICVEYYKVGALEALLKVRKEIFMNAKYGATKDMLAAYEELDLFIKDEMEKTKKLVDVK